jgi:hypothetical protein
LIFIADSSLWKLRGLMFQIFLFSYVRHCPKGFRTITAIKPYIKPMEKVWLLNFPFGAESVVQLSRCKALGSILRISTSNPTPPTSFYRWEDWRVKVSTCLTL